MKRGILERMRRAAGNAWPAFMESVRALAGGRLSVLLAFVFIIVAFRYCRKVITF